MSTLIDIDTTTELKGIESASLTLADLIREGAAMTMPSQLVFIAPDLSGGAYACALGAAYVAALARGLV